MKLPTPDVSTAESEKASSVFAHLRAMTETWSPSLLKTPRSHRSKGRLLRDCIRREATPVISGAKGDPLIVLVHHASRKSFLTPRVAAPAKPVEPPLAPLSEAEISFLETQVPAMAEAATQKAYWDALSRGRSVVCTRGDELIEVAPDGTHRVIDTLETVPSLPVGTTFSLR